ncbi:MAG TPA: DUF5686 family protein [Bacteroidota bacterium]|nr:DUF5686 family protein [Bacteroidota bacterium]
MKSNLFLYFVLFLAMPVAVQAQGSFTVYGKIIDAVTNEPLPMASIRLAHTSQGTVSNAQGEFHYTLSDSSATMIASYVGYSSDTVVLSPITNQFCFFRLQPNAIKMAEVVVTGSTEDPAYEIIRQAIANKKKWMRHLHAYEGKAFTRLEVRIKDSIAAITESYSTLYWQQGDSLREVITQQKQTGNIQKTMQPARVGNIINFNDDTVLMGGFRFTGPTSPDAFENYDYKLLSTRKMDDYEVYVIQVKPRSRLDPLFKGTITIAERSYAVIHAELEPNEAYVQPFVRFKNLRFQQSFRLYNESVWLPVNFHFTGAFEISVMGIKIPSIGMMRDVVIYDYRINPELADSIRALKNFSIDSSSKKIDSIFWNAHNVLPLTAEQDTAYHRLDSTQSLEKLLAPTGTSMKLLNALSTGVMSYVDLSFNRVEGGHLGISKTIDSVTNNLAARGGIAYGTADQQWKWHAGATWHFGEDRINNMILGNGTIQTSEKTFSVGFNAYHQMEAYPNFLDETFTNSISALFFHSDDNDYYLKQGGNIEFSYLPKARTRITVTACAETEHAVSKQTEYSLFYTSQMFRENPPIADGQMNSLKLSATYASAMMASLARSALNASVEIEHASPLFESDFSFTQLNLKLRQKITTMNENLAFPPSLTMYVFGGTTLGHLPPQRYFTLSSNESYLGIPGMMHGIQPREFWGDQYVEFFVEHNFRRAPFALSGIKALYESNLEFIVYAGTARSWLSENVVKVPGAYATDSNGWYYEAGVGISNILDFFRIDVTYRFMKPEGLGWKLTFSDFIMGLFQ